MDVFRMAAMLCWIGQVFFFLLLCHWQLPFPFSLFPFSPFFLSSFFLLLTFIPFIPFVSYISDLRLSVCGGLLCMDGVVSVVGSRTGLCYHRSE